MTKKKQYRIEWKNTITGYIGHGEWREDKHRVEESVEYGNKELPYIVHKVAERDV